jgi:DNA-binding MarR family transcriptional regulator
MSTTRSARLTEVELHAWRGMLESTTLLRSRIEAALQAESGLSEADYTVLLALTETGTDGLRSSTLADVVGWERSRLSHHLGRMEKRGLLRRDPCPTDNRGSELRITAEGARLFRAAAGPHLRSVKELFAEALTAEQLDQLAGIVDALGAHLAGTHATSTNSKKDRS